MFKYFDNFKIFPSSIVKEKQNPQDFTLLILKTKHYRHLQSKTDTVKLKVHDDSLGHNHRKMLAATSVMVGRI